MKKLKSTKILREEFEKCGCEDKGYSSSGGSSLGSIPLRLNSNLGTIEVDIPDPEMCFVGVCKNI